VDPINFAGIGQDTEFEPGCVDYSATWFQARKDVSQSDRVSLARIITDTAKQRLEDSMTPSHTLSHTCAAAWLADIQDMEDDINALLSVIDPDLLQAGISAITQLKHIHQDTPILSLWNSAFSAIGVIVNRKTLAHRDQGGWPACLDMLVAAGNYQDARLVLDDIGASLVYKPGALVALCGKVLRHSVHNWSGGERICYAHYMRNNVHNRLQVKQNTWRQLGDYKLWMSPKFWHRAGFGLKSFPDST
jgi:hypothetical protein